MNLKLKLFVGLMLLLLVGLGCNLSSNQTATPLVPSVFPPTRSDPFPTMPVTTPSVTPEPPVSLTLPTPTAPVLLEPSGTVTETITLASLLNTPLTDVRRSMIYPVGGFEGFEFCDPTLTTPAFQGELPGEVELGTLPFYGVSISSCGWQRGETVTITLTQPDGSTKVETLTFDPDMGLTTFYSFGYGALLGRYTVTVSGQAATLSHSFTVVAPRRPVLLEGRDGWMYLTGFIPGQRLRFVAYDNPPNSMILVRLGWREFFADARGNLLLQDDTGADYVVILTDEGSYFHRSDLLSQFIGDNFRPAVVPPCGGPGSRLADVAEARVVLGSGPNNVRQNPGLRSTLLGQVPAGKVIHILGDEPVCADNMLWWYIGDMGNISGWTSEGQGSTYWLEPNQ
jgi:hypothetical protein